MAVEIQKKYLLGDYELDAGSHSLVRGGTAVPLSRKRFKVLLFLVQQHHKLVSRQDLLERFWDGHEVYEENLTKCISEIRKALDDQKKPHQFIETVPAVGYRYIGPLEEEALQPEASSFALERTRGVKIVIEDDDGQKAAVETQMALPAKSPAPLNGHLHRVGPGKGSWLRPAVLAVVLVAAGSLAAGAFIIYRSRTKAAAISSAPIRSVAVLPLKSLNAEANDQYLGLGISDSIIARISQINALTVRPTSAVRKYVNPEVDSLEAAREQKVDAVLDGTVQRSGDRLRVTVNLLKVSDGSSLWADTFNLSFNDIFTMQDEVSRQIAARLRVKLNETEAARLAKRNTSSLDAYNYYARAMYHFGNIGPDLNTRSESDLSIDLFKKAIELDPNYALAHAQLGYTYARIAVFQEENPALIEQAKQELASAEKLNPQLAEVHTARYFIAFSQYEGWQIETGISELRLAQEIAPNVGHSELGDLYNHIGLEKQAAEEFELALTVDPNNDAIKNSYVTESLQQAKPDEGLELNKRLLNRGADVRYYLDKGMVKEAEPLIEDEQQKRPHSDIPRIQRLLLLALQGKHEAAEAAVPAFLEKLRRNRGYHHYTYYVACIYALGGKKEEALKWLRVTVKEGFPCYPLFLRDRFLDPIRTDPAFVKFLAEMKEQWEGYLRKFG
jgi:TolB-like protein/DNA-binding winged helix-turn-helix (wHTH) protein/Tfp pilus assembly protein PilF